MSETTVVYSDLKDSTQAGLSLGTKIKSDLNGKSPHAVILFSSSSYNYSLVLKALEKSCEPAILIGCSSAGEFINGQQGTSAISALAIYSDEMKFNIGIGHGLRKDRILAAKELVSSFQGKSNLGFAYRSVLLLTDALAGHTDDLIEKLTVLTSGNYQFFGGGSGDDANFSKTHVFVGTEAFTDAVVGLEILSNKPLGIGVQHGWQPASEPMRVTESNGLTLKSLNSIPAAEIFEEYAENSKQNFDKSAPVPFFLHNVLGIKTESGYKLRVPLSVESDGSIICASDVPFGSLVCIMKASSTSSIQAAQGAVNSALQQIEGYKPKAALFFDCVATRLRMGGEFGLELSTLSDSLGNETQYAGCNSYGQIARVQGQFSGFHNCTAVVCIIPE